MKRTIKRAVQFRRDYRREQRGRYAAALDQLLTGALDALADDMPLAPRMRDHALTGDWLGCRDCHLRPDLVLIYRSVGEDRLELVRLGSHSLLRL